MVVSNVQAASVAKSTTEKGSYTDAVYSQMVDAFGNSAGPSSTYASGGMLFAGPGAPTVEREFMLPAMHVTPNGAWIDGGTGAAATGVAYGSGYDGAFSAWSPGGEWNQVDLNAAAFRSAMGSSEGSSWDALTTVGKWLDTPIGALENLSQTVLRGNAIMAEGLDAIGLHGLASAQRGLGQVTSSSVPTRPWEMALSVAPLAGEVGPAMRAGATMLGPKAAGMAEGFLARNGLLLNAAENGAAGSAAIIQRGGAHGEVKGMPGYESHHMPADSISPVPTSQGPSIAMEISDHRSTASWGSSREARAYRQQQAALIEQGDFKAAQQMDIRDVQTKFGSKYDDAIRQMLDYMNMKGY